MHMSSPENFRNLLTTQPLADWPVFFAAKIFSGFGHVLFIKQEAENKLILKTDSLFVKNGQA